MSKILVIIEGVEFKISSVMGDEDVEVVIVDTWRQKIERPNTEVVPESDLNEQLAQYLNAEYEDEEDNDNGNG